MKTKKVERKLTLKKVTVSQVGIDDLIAARGGDGKSSNTCDTMTECATWFTYCVYNCGTWDIACGDTENFICM